MNPIGSSLVVFAATQHSHSNEKQAVSAGRRRPRLAGSTILRQLTPTSSATVRRRRFRAKTDVRA